MKKKTIAFLPVRKGSKSIPFKNFKLIGGKPLFCWVSEAAIDCDQIDQLIISTDYEDIKSVAPYIFDSPKTKLFRRSEESATDTASTEAAMFDFLDREQIDFDSFVLIQATCPFTTSEDLTLALNKYNQVKADSLLTLVTQKKFFWKINPKSDMITPLNYNPLKRPRRQDMNFQYWENGAFYITSKQSLLSSRCRISGNVTCYIMNDIAAIDIDTPADWLVANQLLLKKSK